MTKSKQSLTAPFVDLAIAEAEGGTTKPSTKVTPDGAEEAERARAAATATGVLRKEPICLLPVFPSCLCQRLLVCAISLSLSLSLSPSRARVSCLRVLKKTEMERAA